MTSPYTVRPISDRTRFSGKHQRSNFDTPWPSTEALLIREVRHLRGKDLVIEADFTESDLRLDGRPYANARPATPAVRVAFESMHGPLTYATDRFSTWQDNVRAVALGLEALRKVDRYGITKKGEQYAGWKALPSGAGHLMTADEAEQVLRAHARIDNPSISLGPVFRRARANTHPDAVGNRLAWDEVEAAAKILGLL